MVTILREDIYGKGKPKSQITWGSLFHASPSRNEGSILSKGLDPKRSRSVTAVGRAVWLSADIQGALENASDEHSGPLTIFKVDLPDSFTVRDIQYMPDLETDLVIEEVLDELTYSGHIPSKYITIHSRTGIDA